MKTCPQCRKQITRTTAKYCYRCGYRIIKNTTISAISRSVTQVPAPSRKTLNPASTTPVPAKEPSGTISEQFDQIMRDLTPQQHQYFLNWTAKEIADIKESRADISQASFATSVLRNSPPKPPVEARVSSLASEDSENLGLLAVVAEDELAGEELTSSEARMNEWSARYRKERRAGSAGILSGLMICVAALVSLHSLGIHVRPLPFAHIGGERWISLALPTGIKGWLLELSGTILIIASLAVPIRGVPDVIRGACIPIARIKGPAVRLSEFRHWFAITLVSLLPYAIGAVCLGFRR